MNLYRCWPCADADWQILVIAPNARAAKRVGFPAVKQFDSDAEFIHCRVNVVRDLVPPGGSVPMVIESCREAPWTCTAWDHSLCPECPTAGRSKVGDS